MQNPRDQRNKARAVNSNQDFVYEESRASFSREQLEQIALKYSRMIQASPDAITLRSLPERRYVEVNAGFERLTGYTAAEVIGKTPKELGIWIEDGARAETLRKVEREGGVYNEEFRFRKKSGEIRYGRLSAVKLELNGQPFMLSLTHDITDLKRTAEELRVSEANFRSLMEEAPFGIFRLTEEGKLLSVNPALIEMLGFESQAELLASDVAQNIHQAAPEQAASEAPWSRDQFRERQTEWRRKDGQILTVRLTGRRVTKSTEAESYFEVFAEDTTERQSLEKQLLQSQKMDAIGRLAGGIAHDFNNLLGVILGHSEIVEDRLAQEPRMRKSAEAIRSAAERAAALTKQLLAFSRKQMVEPRNIEINSAVREMQKLVRRVLREDIELVIRLSAEGAHIKIDPSQLDQVIMNLVVNARDAMPDGGKLILTTAELELDETYVKRHVGAQSGRYVMLSVSDTGIGMDEPTLSRIFEPFFTTKEKDKGTGLGLSTVYGIVKQAGGYIMPYSEPGHGTTMKIYFPRVEKQGEAEKHRISPQVNPRGAETILLVEDETALREMTRSILEESGYRVLEAAGTQEALRIAQDLDLKIDLLLTDVVMPGSGGSELAKGLATLRPQLKVLFMSGYADDVLTDKRGLATGMVLIQKPFTKRDLLTKLRQFLDGGA